MEVSLVGQTMDHLNCHLFSFFFFQYRAQFRREANQADNKAATVAVDSLINFEAVKVRKSVATPSH